MADCVILPSGCKKSPKPHPPHYWIEGWIWPKTIDCPGIPDQEPNASHILSPNEWRATRAIPEVEALEPHRHFYKLTTHIRIRSVWYLNNFLVSPFEYGWQCECGSWNKQIKADLKDEMLPSRLDFDQTWPS